MSDSPTYRRILPKNPVASLSQYVEVGGGRALERARTSTPEEIIDELTTSGLRGRGGAGFPTGPKWRSILTGGGRHHYAVCNAAEGEPGTFKDRTLIRTNPYQVIEGLLVTARVVDAVESFIVVKASFRREIDRLVTVVDEMSGAGWLDGVEIRIVPGPEEYLLGEEKALLEVVEGNDPLPRRLPPYLHGLYATAPQLGWEAHDPESGHLGAHMANPTLVNNAETLAQAAWIIAHGAAEFRTAGTERSPGTILCTVVGDVTRPAVVEVPMGVTLGELLGECGGPRPGRVVKAVLPGVANGALDRSSLDVPLTYEDLQARNSGLGSAGFIVYDDTTCMVEVAATLSRFLYVESCGQCLPCKLGTGQVTAALDRLVDGTGVKRDLAIVEERLRIVADGNRCYLPVQEQNLISSLLRLFPEDFMAHLRGRCSSPRKIRPPKIVDLADHVVTYDQRQERKRPDWTYA